MLNFVWSRGWEGGGVYGKGEGKRWRLIVGGRFMSNDGRVRWKRGEGN